MFRDVDVQVQVRFVPEPGRRGFETCLFPHRSQQLSVPFNLPYLLQYTY